MSTARQSITLATAGHVDHGKTSLVRQLSGTDTDTLADEKSRGLSINLGFAYYHLDGDGQAAPLTIGFVDVPGHTDFINNALAGIGAADYALLVIAADDGVMPQTREHLAIINLLQIRGGAIALTKIDQVLPERLAEAQREVGELVSGTVLEGTPVFSVSSKTGMGIAALLAHLELLARQTATQPADQRRLARFAVDRAFTVKGIGTVVTGTVMAGQLDSTVPLAHAATGAGVRVKGIRHDQKAIAHALAGERVAIAITLPHQQVARGDWLVHETLHNPVFRIDVRLDLLEPLSLKSGVSYHFYHGTSHQLVQIRQLGDPACPYYQVASAEPLHACLGDRFILRDPACERTLGGGSVIDVFVPRRGRNTAERLADLLAMDQQDYPALVALLQQAGGGVELDRFARNRNLSRAALAELLDRLDREQTPHARFTIEDHRQPILLHQRFLDQAGQQILAALAAYHGENPGKVGVGEPVLSKLVGYDRSHLLFHAILNRLIGEGHIRRTGTLLHLPGHQAQLSREELEFLERIRPLLLEAGFVPPRTRELVELTGMKLGGIERILAAARKAGSLVQVAANRHYLPETMVQLAEFTETLATNRTEGFTVIQFRDGLGIGRNLCIEILEYFDRVGFTVRDGNNRHLRTSMENVFGKAGTKSENAAADGAGKR